MSLSLPQKRPIGLTIFSIIFIGAFVFSVLPLLPHFFMQGLREGVALGGRNPFPWAASLGGVLTLTLLCVGSVGVYFRREVFRKLLLFASALFALGLPWFFPLAPFEDKAQEILREAGFSSASCSVADLSLLLPAFSAVAYLVFYFGAVLFFVWFLFYLCHPGVKRWFRPTSAGPNAPEPS